MPQYRAGFPNQTWLTQHSSITPAMRQQCGWRGYQLAGGMNCLVWQHLPVRTFARGLSCAGITTAGAAPAPAVSRWISWHATSSSWRASSADRVSALSHVPATDGSYPATPDAPRRADSGTIRLPWHLPWRTAPPAGTLGCFGRIYKRRLLALCLMLLLVSGAQLLDPGAPEALLCKPPHPMPERTAAFKTMVVFRLGPCAGLYVVWNARTTLPTLGTIQPFEELASRLQLPIGHWLFQDRAVGPLEACGGRWRTAAAALAFPVRSGAVPSVADSVAAFNLHIRPLERAPRTRSKYETHRLSVLTLAVWKDILPRLLPMTDDLLRAYIWDSLAFGVTLPVLKHCVDAIKAWHGRLGLSPPASGPGDYRRLTNCLSRFQATTQKIKFPIHRAAVVCAYYCWNFQHTRSVLAPDLHPAHLVARFSGPSCTAGSTASQGRSPLYCVVDVRR
jgi:hypothetical protein